MPNENTPGEQLVEKMAADIDVEKEIIEDEIEKWLGIMVPYSIPSVIRQKHKDGGEKDDKTTKNNLGARKRQVVERDDYQCRNCGDSEEELHVDYIVPEDYDDAGNRHISNMVTLCKPCFSKKEIDPTVRDAEYPNDWEEFRKKVYEKDYYSCQNCGLMGSARDEGATELHAHHIVPLSKRGNNILSNCVTLCEFCHKKCHYNMRKG